MIQTESLTNSSPLKRLEHLATQFAHWRSTKTNRRTPVPEHLRSQVLALMGAYSKSEIIHALGITYTMMNQWLASKNSPSVKPAQTFVALPREEGAVSTSTRQALDFTLGYENGSTLRIRGEFSCRQVTALFEGLRPSGEVRS